MKTLYGMCPNEHLLWKCSSDCTSLLIYYWDGEMLAEDELPDVWEGLYDTGFEEDCIVPIGVIKSAMNALEVHDVRIWATRVDEEMVAEETVAGSASLSFRELLTRLKNGARVANYRMPNGVRVVELFDIPAEMRVRDFLSHAVPFIWKRAIQGTTPRQKCDIAIENLKKLMHTYGPDPVFSKALGALGRARQEIVDNEKNHDIFKTLKEDPHEPKAVYRPEKITNIDVKKLYSEADKSIKNHSSSKDNDPVNHPSHYQLHGGMEVIDIIEAATWGLPSDEAYAIGNAIKYICRYRNKGKPVQDLEKARWYLNRAIENYRNTQDWEDK